MAGEPSSKRDGRECCAVNAVAANASAGDNDFIAGVGFFLMPGLAVDFARDEADCADEDQGFPTKRSSKLRSLAGLGCRIGCRRPQRPRSRLS